MKRIGNLWLVITSLLNLFGAAKSAARGKRFRADVALSLMNLECEILRLRDEMEAGTYEPGPYRTFLVNEGKQRLISAAPFRDRVVHHALTGIIEPIFERRFTHDSFACRKEFGTHKAIAHAQKGCRKYKYVLKCDVAKYFASIDHVILKGLLERVIKCRRTLDLTGKIIDGSNEQEEVLFYYPGDDLFTIQERRRGLPLGNQTSQFFANVYLNPLDHFVKRELKPGLYARYVDDFLLFSNGKTALNEMRLAIEDFLTSFRLRIHAGKSRVYRVSDGITFLGWRIFPNRLRLVRENVVRFRRRLRKMQYLFAEGDLDVKELKQRISAWIGHAGFGDTWNLRSNLFSGFAFQRRSAA